MHNAFARVALILFIILCCAHVKRISAQPAAKSEDAAAISGRIVQESNGGLRGITVVLRSSEPSVYPKISARAITDGDGSYILSGLSPGRYQVIPVAPAWIVDDQPGAGSAGKQVIVVGGESVMNIDFTLTPGGVITGRVTDDRGRPVVQEMVSFAEMSMKSLRTVATANPFRAFTDDRGIYRIYGLPPGSYRVSAGVDGDGGNVMGGSTRFYRRIFYPGTTREAEAEAVEVKPGSEITGVDLALGRHVKTFQAVGRIVIADSGEPAPGIRLGYGIASRNNGRPEPAGATRSDAAGRFQLAPLRPERYVIFPILDEWSGWYCDPVTFEVGASDVSGLELRIRRGASLSGSIVIEGARDRATSARLLSGIHLNIAYVPRGEVHVPGFNLSVRPAADGSFHVNGLRPGSVRLITGWPPVNGLTLLRVEYGGIDRSEGIEALEGTDVRGVRVVFAYGVAAIRGRVNVVNGVLPPQSRLAIMVLRPGGSSHFTGRHADIDARGRFAVEGLPSGDYELVVQAIINGRRTRELRQRITLAEDGEMDLSLTLDIGDENN